MKRHEYLLAPEVEDFIVWIEKRLDTAYSFVHSYKMKRPVKNWDCDSLYSAFENYTWSFRYRHPVHKRVIKGNSYQHSYEALIMLSEGLRKSIVELDNEMCREYCFSILEWGGVLFHNDKRILELGNNVCHYFMKVQKRFQSDLAYYQYYNKDVMMNSGFTKIYSLCIDDFIIYDGRVGAALGLLVRKYCEEKGLEDVPETLVFAWGKGKGNNSKADSKNRRDPSAGRYIFPQLSNNPRRHTESNIRANWLLQSIVDRTTSKFSFLDKAARLRALEASLFMIGYCVNDNS